MNLLWSGLKCCKIGVSSRRIKGLQAFILHFPGSGCMQMGLTRHKSPLIQFPFSWLNSLSLSPIWAYFVVKTLSPPSNTEEPKWLLCTQRTKKFLGVVRIPRLCKCLFALSQKQKIRGREREGPSHSCSSTNTTRTPSYYCQNTFVRRVFR